MIFAYLIIITALVLILYDHRSGIIASLLVITNFGEFVYVNPNLEIGDFGGIGTIYFMDLFWIAMIFVILLKKNNMYLFNYKFSFSKARYHIAWIKRAGKDKDRTADTYIAG